MFPRGRCIFASIQHGPAFVVCVFINAYKGVFLVAKLDQLTWHSFYENGSVGCGLVPPHLDVETQSSGLDAQNGAKPDQECLHDL